MINKTCNAKEEDIPLEPTTTEAQLRARIEILEFSLNIFKEENSSLKKQLYKDSFTIGVEK